MLDTRLTIPQPTSDGIIPTLNKMGYMFSPPDRVVQSFMDYAQEQRKKVLDIGCAYGVASIPLAKQQIEVIACDADERHIKLLQESLTVEERKFITPIHGTMPHTVSFEPNSFQAVLMSLVLHFLKPEEIQQSFKLIHQWLNPGGLFFATIASPYAKNLVPFSEIFIERKKQNNPWPGVIENAPEYAPERSKGQIPEYMQVMDTDTLRRVAEQAKFEIVELFYYTKENLPEDVQLDGREFVGLVGRKGQ
ncbi:MAG: methyltransferase domain-containing protein [Alphaproteobacteria bacterium]